MQVSDVRPGSFIKVPCGGQYWAYHNPVLVLSIKPELVKTPNGNRNAVSLEVEDRNKEVWTVQLWAESDVENTSHAGKSYE